MTFQARAWSRLEQGGRRFAATRGSLTAILAGESISGQNAMRGLGIQKGDRVAMLSQIAIACLKLLRDPLLGSILMPLNFRLVPDDFDVHIESRRRESARRGRWTHPLIKFKFATKLQTVEHFNDCERCLEGGRRRSARYEIAHCRLRRVKNHSLEIDENETSALLYTSGTTGRPKGVMLTPATLHHAMTRSASSYSRTRTFTAHARTVSLHGWGVGYAVTGMVGLT